jgi:hypothetical protein
MLGWIRLGFLLAHFKLLLINLPITEFVTYKFYN